MNEWKQQQITHFDKIAGDYNGIKQNNYVLSIADEIYDWVFDKKVLYMCCGTGNLLNHINPKSAHGVDISSEMIRKAVDAFPKHTFELGDAENYATARKYDVCLLIECIDHLENWQEAFNRAKKCADVVIVNTVAKRWYPMLRFLELARLKMDEGQNKWVPPKELEKFIGDYDEKRTIYRGLSVFYKV